MNRIYEAIIKSNVNEIIDIVRQKWEASQEPCTYRYIIKEFRKRLPKSAEYGLKESSIERIVRLLAQKKIISRHPKEALFAPAEAWMIMEAQR